MTADPDQLLGGLGADHLVVTANRRLAAYLTARHDRVQRAAGKRAWAAPNILSLSAWIGTLRERIWPEQPHLNSHQSALLWERIIARGDHGLLNPAAAARKAEAAWELAVRWQLPLPQGWDASPEVAAFRHWSRDYQAALAAGQWADPARDIHDAVHWLERVELPGHIHFAGFDRQPPDLLALKAELARLGVTVAAFPGYRFQPDPSNRPAGPHRLACDDPVAEARLLARWARRRLLERPDARIGVVVPDVGAYRSLLVQSLTEQLTPGRVAGDGPSAINVSLGDPLARVPVVAAALALLSVGERPEPVLTDLLRGPFMGALAEESPRALAAAKIRSERWGELSLRRMITLLQKADPPLPLTLEMLSRWQQRLTAERAPLAPSAWARRFSDLLDALGWPGELPQDSAAFQAVQKWQELLLQLASLDLVCGPIPRQEAVARLAGMAGRTVFQPEGADAPVQVMGVLEAAGMGFDHLWLVGFSDELWPPSPNPNPFLPLSLQRERGLPRADARAELAFADGVTERLLAAAPEVVASHPRQMEGGPVGGSPLLAHLPLVPPAEWAEGFAEDVSVTAHMAALQPMTALADRHGPALAGDGNAAGGISLFADQSACPFRAFAVHRLGARTVDEAEPGLDAAGRGSLVHRAMELLWRQLKHKHGLDRAGENGTLPERVRTVAGQAVAELCQDQSDGFKAVEVDRVTGLMLEWLKVEQARPPFTVIGLEQKGTATAGGVTVTTRIDRIDRLADGGEVLIDYKTGKSSFNDWFGDRPDAPQLPLYLTERKGNVSALAFARLKKCASGFAGLSKEPDLLPRVKSVSDADLPDGVAPDWGAITTEWGRVLDRLGRAFGAGEAAVDPKDRNKSCQYCDLPPLCRIWERDADQLKGISPDDQREPGE